MTNPTQAAKRILVTGGRGFIGTNLVAELRSRGHDVWTCDILHGEDPEHVRTDVYNYAQLDAIFSKRTFEYVYHLAAEYGRWNGEDHYARQYGCHSSRQRSCGGRLRGPRS